MNTLESWIKELEEAKAASRESAREKGIPGLKAADVIAGLRAHNSKKKKGEKPTSLEDYIAKHHVTESLAGEARAAEHEYAHPGASSSGGSPKPDEGKTHKLGVFNASGVHIRSYGTHSETGGQARGRQSAMAHAKKIGGTVKMVRESEEMGLEILDEALPDWAQQEFDKAFPKKNKKRTADADDGPSFTMTTKEKEAGVKRKADQAAAAARAKVTRVVKGTRGMSYDPDQEEIITHKHEHPAGAPKLTPHTALDNNPMVPKVKVSSAQKAAGPQRPKGKAATAAAMAEYRKALRAHNMKKESYVFDGEQFVSATDLNENTEEIVLNILREKQTYTYKITFGDEVIFEGVGVTPNGILNESMRKVKGIVENIQHKDGQVDRIKSIVKKYV
jgi:hypothetical protein